MPLSAHPPDDVGVKGGMLARDKKGGLYTALFQAVQKLLRIGGMGPVVEGDRDLLLLRRIPGGLLCIRKIGGRSGGGT